MTGGLLDITDRRVNINCAAVGAGTYHSLEQAMEAMRPEPSIVEPDPQKSQDYAQCYARWRTTYKWLEDLNEKWYEQVEL